MLKLNVVQYRLERFVDIDFRCNGLVYALFIDNIIAKQLSGYRQSMRYITNDWLTMQHVLAALSRHNH